MRVGRPGRKPGPNSKSKNPRQVPTRLGKAVIPPAPEGLPEKYQQLWRDYWSSPVGRSWDPVLDVQVISRLFSMYRDIDDFEVLYRKDPTPDTRRLLMKIRAQALAIEDRCGLSLMSKVPFGGFKKEASTLPTRWDAAEEEGQENVN